MQGGSRRDWPSRGAHKPPIRADRAGPPGKSNQGPCSCFDQADRCRLSGSEGALHAENQQEEERTILGGSRARNNSRRRFLGCRWEKRVPGRFSQMAPRQPGTAKTPDHLRRRTRSRRHWRSCVRGWPEETWPVSARRISQTRFLKTTRRHVALSGTRSTQCLGTPPALLRTGMQSGSPNTLQPHSLACGGARKLPRTFFLHPVPRDVNMKNLLLRPQRPIRAPRHRD